jgi:alpha-glucosidase (family GH31 glycosyl hydrolase)
MALIDDLSLTQQCNFCRNHNDMGTADQDPGMWPSVAAAARKANLFRYRHLPYLYR